MFSTKKAILTGFRGDNAPPGPHAAAASIRGIAHPFHIAQLQHFCVKRQKSDAPKKSRRRAMSAEITAVPHGRGRRPRRPGSNSEIITNVRRIRIHPVGRAGPFHLSKAPSPIPSPSGGGCRPQGRPERENVTEPRCGNDRQLRGKATVLPSASGHVLPLPSSASRGIGGCHLPPLGEGKGGCEFAGRGSLPLALLPGRRDAAPYNKMLRIRPKAFAWEESAVVNENRPH